jgi:ankyrin repeat protein
MKRLMSKLIVGVAVGCVCLAACGNVCAGELVNAAEQGDLEQIKKLIEVQGVQVDEPGDHSQTALIWASYKGHLNVVKYLLEKGADVNHKETGHGKNALMMAAEGGHLEIVESLLKRKADASATNKYGGTALMSAAQNGNTNIVATLLVSGGEIDRKGNEGQTALMLASGMGHLPTVTFLISKGANSKLKDNAGRTPEDWARIARHFEVASYLQDEATGKSKAQAVKEGHGTFGKAVTFAEKDNRSGNKIKCAVTINTHGSSTGGFTPKGMRQYEVWARIENLTDAKAELGIGPMEMVDNKGESYGGIIYNGPIQVFAGGIEMVLGEITGEPSATITLGPKQVVEKLRLFVTIPDNVKPQEFNIVLGTKEPRKIRLKFAE